MEIYQRQRNAFVSVWLWLSVICSAIYMVILLIGLIRISEFASSLPTEFLISLYSPCFLAACTLVGYIQLLRWKRRGYGTLLSITLVNILLNVLWANEAKLELGIEGVEAEVNYFEIVVIPLISMLILFLILQIKKNGVSYWDAMALDYSQPQEPSAPTHTAGHGTYCPHCGNANLPTSRYCTACGDALMPSVPPVPPTPPVPPAPPTPPVPPAPPVQSVPLAADTIPSESVVMDRTEICSEDKALESGFEQEEPGREQKTKKNKRLWIWLASAAIVLVAVVVCLCLCIPDEAGYSDDEAPQYEAVPVFDSSTGTHYGHEWVDLGLSSGLMWATCNVGASSPEGYGSHFAWGEVESAESGNTKTRLGEEMANESLDISGSRAYDAARVNWSGYWRMPSYDEYEELIRECIWRWKTLNGVQGYEVTGSNGNSIFLPAASERPGYGYYWSSYGGGFGAADYLAFGEEFMEVSAWGDRRHGFTIRPVYSADTSDEEPVPTSDTFYRKGVLSVKGVIYPMAYVEGGVFETNSVKERIGDYYIGKYEVTQELWKAVMGTDVIEQRNKANPKWSLRGVGDDLPMYYVNYHEAVEFCERLQSMTGQNFRLPTEAQWEYAARGVNNDYSDYGVDGIAWYNGNSGEVTHEVGTKMSNDRGLYDMCGNVREWCDGWYGSKRALRGGGWYNDEEAVHVSSRYSDEPQVRDNNYGFRICL